MIKIVRDFNMNESSGNYELEDENGDGEDYENGEDEYEADDHIPLDEIIVPDIKLTKDSDQS